MRCKSQPQRPVTSQWKKLPAEVLEHEAEIARARAKEEGKPDNVVEKIIEGRLDKFKDEVVLPRQAYIRDESLTIEKLILQSVAAIGENIIVRRFQRWELGENLDRLVYKMTNRQVGHFYNMTVVWINENKEPNE